ncbi:LLM class flavin-dependent oxidoreductase [Nocardia sp. alder85J]|uniref:LLM class flavin-dependent oxidoreductase n=1 Tax=Nocardia sp. alder85J TaxID=2862949 RepID=UPI001CD66EB6|nr:LLM class flavin-dependent oxidoreductase [Nocardia sp. alder85J]MCX4099207.1 LLM class flavin-dependent oxidoreductase [Nocardia sp. alder85J]
MGIPILIDLAVGAADFPPRSAPAADGTASAVDTATPPEPVSLSDAVAIAAAAREAGVAALRLPERAGERRALDPSVAGAYLAGVVGDLGYLVDLPTTHNAPYNAARRILSFDRATAGRTGVVLRPGAGDEVSDATTPDPTALTAAERWAEYARILARLWESFPRVALIGDAERALVADDALIAAIDHDGRGYRVAGPLDGPSSVQGRPVIAATDPAELGWAVVAGAADVVIVEADVVAGADAALTEALDRVDRRRTGIALIGRVAVDLGRDPRVVADELAEWAATHRLDGLEPTTAGGAEALLTLVRELVPLLAASPAATLRASLGLYETAAVPR